MDELGFYAHFKSGSVISGRWKGEHEILWAMKRRLGSGRISRDPKSGALTARPRGRFERMIYLHETMSYRTRGSNPRPCADNPNVQIG